MIQWYRNIKVKLLEKIMKHNFSLAKLSLSLSADSGLENSSVYLKISKLIFSLNFNSLSGDNFVWRKCYE